MFQYYIVCLAPTGGPVGGGTDGDGERAHVRSAKRTRTATAEVPFLVQSPFRHYRACTPPTDRFPRTQHTRFCRIIFIFNAVVRRLPIDRWSYFFFNIFPTQGGVQGARTDSRTTGFSINNKYQVIFFIFLTDFSVVRYCIFIIIWRFVIDCILVWKKFFFFFFI